MASLLLFLRAIVSGSEERLTGEQEAAAQERRLEAMTLRTTACGGRDAGSAEEVERWVVACLEWPRVDRKSAWMQIIWHGLGVDKLVCQCHKLVRSNVRWWFVLPLPNLNMFFPATFGWIPYPCLLLLKGFQTWPAWTLNAKAFDSTVAWLLEADALQYCYQTCVLPLNQGSARRPGSPAENHRHLGGPALASPGKGRASLDRRPL